MNDEAEIPPLREVSPFFNVNHGDLILRTSDNTELHVDLHAVAFSSPLLAAKLLSLPPTSLHSTKPTQDVDGTSDVWDLLLPIIHHTYKQAPDIDAMAGLLQTAGTYQMTGILRLLGDLLAAADFVEQQPLKVYALACTHGFDRAARLAARRTLRLPMHLGYVPELGALTGSAYHHLLEYRKECTVAAQAVLNWQIYNSPPAWFDSRSDMSESKAELARFLESTANNHSGINVSPSGAVTRNGIITRQYTIKAEHCWRVAMENLARELEAQPDPVEILTPSFLKPLLLYAQAAKNTLHVVEAAHGLSKIIREQLDEAIAKVTLKMET
ncbi:hypothetical protein TRAPUB_12454 [Trametes pubescens]|uniref:BTB domain-containing protein n=1 Tax=Trametes pubescens TaxID=154538 RepID=A0A1M2VU37_TRAPU|nr:hypothetical protein TRAPUB_12454 [Trametes pubescens]